MHRPAYTSACAHTGHTHVMYALLKHIHWACWDLPATNNRGVRCEVCICHIGVLSACEVAVNEESRWRSDIARRSRWTLPKLPVPKLSPSSPSIPDISAPLSGSAQLPEPPKMSCTAESSLNGRHTHAGLTHQGRGLKGFYQFSLLFYISWAKSKWKEFTVHNSIYRKQETFKRRTFVNDKSFEHLSYNLQPD